jgi:hypothetical protein
MRMEVHVSPKGWRWSRIGPQIRLRIIFNFKSKLVMNGVYGTIWTGTWALS